MAQTPLVSVVIATYNRADYICETIDSVLAQTYAPVEIIVIDDGSTDNTAEVVAKYGSQIKYVRQANAERAAARNHGLRLATGEFVSFLDSDDVWLPNKITDEAAVLIEQPRIGLVYSQVELIDSQSQVKGRKSMGCSSGKVTEKLLEKNLIFLSGNLIRTAAVRQINGFNEDRRLSGSEDWELWVRLSCGWDFACVKNLTTRYREHSNNTMSNASAMESAMSFACHLFETGGYLSPAQKKILPKTRATLALTSAINYCSNGERKTSFENLLKAAQSNFKIVLDPRFGYTLLRVVAGDSALEQLGLRKSR